MILTLHRVLLSFSVVAVTASLSAGMRIKHADAEGFREVYFSKGAPSGKEFYEARRKIVWLYGGERVVFHDGVVAPVSMKMPGKTISSSATPEEQARTEREERRLEKSRRLKALKRKKAQRRRELGIGPKESLNAEEIENLFSAFGEVGEKDKGDKKKKK